MIYTEIIYHCFPFLDDCNLRLFIYRDPLLKLTNPTPHSAAYHALNSLVVYNKPTSSIQMDTLGFQVAVVAGAAHQVSH